MEWIFFAAMLVLAAFLRFYKLGVWSFWGDELKVSGEEWSAGRELSTEQAVSLAMSITPGEN